MRLDKKMETAERTLAMAVSKAAQPIRAAGGLAWDQLRQRLKYTRNGNEIGQWIVDLLVPDPLPPGSMDYLQTVAADRPDETRAILGLALITDFNTSVYDLGGTYQVH